MKNTQTKMKVAYCTKYGSPEVIQVKQFEIPTPKENEILVKVFAASVTTADSMMRSGTPFYGRLFLGLTKPKNPIMGTGFAGEIVAIGNKVSLFEIGDEVFGETTLNFSANAEYLVINENGILDVKPKNISFKEAALVCDGLLTSYNFLTNIGKIKPGDEILINGASGSLGTAAVQLAKHFGAKVTGVCSTSNFALVKSLGADAVIDYKMDDFTKAANKYDFIYDTIGKSSFTKCKKSLKENGVYMSPVLSMDLLFDSIRTPIMKKKIAKFSATGLLKENELKEMLETITELLVSDIIQMVIDKEFVIKEIQKAHQYIDTGRKRGNIVLVMNE
ncbi:MAG: NADPH:quinone reductase-like Zn-dependent oxidoreductase [Planctomycetota bacterium]|jgi:NADPH:quinone reductase-like Zn-dependent oxidoreductase